jgi:hypothetical protein
MSDEDSTGIERVTGEVVVHSTSELAMQLVDAAATHESDRPLKDVKSPHELKLWVDLLDSELRPIVTAADKASDRARLMRYREFLIEMVLGLWLNQNVGADAAPLPNIGRITSDAQLPEWFGDTPNQRSKRGTRCRRLYDIGPGELYWLFLKSEESKRRLTEAMVMRRWRDLNPDKAKSADQLGHKSASPETRVRLMFSGAPDLADVYDALVQSGVSKTKASQRAERLLAEVEGTSEAEKQAILRGAMIAAGASNTLQRTPRGRPLDAD